jgi:hypothetical protein
MATILNGVTLNNTFVNIYGGELPTVLFAAGEQGVWYDPSDMSTLFQDVAGTTPVTAVEQPVGLMLDKRGGVPLGAQLVTNGTFDVDLTGWSTLSPATAAWSSDGIAIIRNGASFQSQPGQQISIVAGKTYLLVADITVAATGGGGGELAIFSADRTTGRTPAAFMRGSSVGTIVGLFTATVTESAYLIAGIGGVTNGAVTIDNISVREVSGNPAIQTSSSKRPTLSARVNLLTKTQELDDAVWAASSMTITDGATDPNGGTTANTLAATGANGTVTQSLTAVAASHTFSVWLRRKTGTGDVDISCHSSGTWVTQSITSDWAQYSVTQALTAGTRTPGIRIVTSGDEVEAWGADLRVANDGLGLPTYQRVNTSTDYDTSGFLMYLLFDGSDDSMETQSINFTSTDKFTAFSGIRKFTDPSGVAQIFELSSNVNLVSGVFAHSFSLTNKFVFVSKGSVAALAATTSATYDAPLTAVCVGTGDISGDRVTLSINSASVASSTSDQGSGNYGDYPLYIGSRGGATQYFSGRLYSLIVRGAATPAGVVSSIENYVNSKTKAY